MRRTTVPHFDELFVPAIVAMKAKGGSISSEKLRQWVADYLGVTEDLLARPALDGSTTEFEFQISLACTYLRSFGAIMQSDDHGWTLTERGSRVGHIDVPNILREVRGEWREAAPAKHFEAPPPVEPKPLAWEDQLVEALVAMRPDGFEKLCLRVLKSKGFRKIEVTGRSADGGFSGVGMMVVRGQARRIIIQSKRWTTSVGPGVVRDLHKSIAGRADGGQIITTAVCTPEARREASRAEPMIEVIDRDQLCTQLMELRLGVAVHSADDIEVDMEFLNAL